MLLGAHQRAVGGDDLGPDDAVGGVAVRAREPAGAAAERVADDADRRRRARQRREAVRRGGGDHVAPQRAGADAGGAAGPIDLDRRHRRGPQQHAVVGRPHHAMTRRLHGEREVVLAREPDRGHDVGDAASVDDHRRPRVVPALPRHPGAVVAVVARGEHAPRDALPQRRNVGPLEPRHVSHDPPGSQRARRRDSESPDISAGGLASVPGYGYPYQRQHQAPFDDGSSRRMRLAVGHPALEAIERPAVVLLEHEREPDVGDGREGLDRSSGCEGRARRGGGARRRPVRRPRGGAAGHRRARRRARARPRRP